jgi:hypothetical protein
VQALPTAKTGSPPLEIYRFQDLLESLSLTAQIILAIHFQQPILVALELQESRDGVTERDCTSQLLYAQEASCQNWCSNGMAMMPAK